MTVASMMRVASQIATNKIRHQDADRVRGEVAMSGKARCTQKIAKIILLNSPSFWTGTMYEYTAKSVGCGVYEITGKEV